jgi:hypothetical protein
MVIGLNNFLYGAPYKFQIRFAPNDVNYHEVPQKGFDRPPKTILDFVN